MRRATLEGKKVNPIPSNNNMANIKFQEGATIKQFAKGFSKHSTRGTARRNLPNANASMLNSRNHDILSEGRLREANESAGPNINSQYCCIFLNGNHNLKLSIDNKKRQNRFKLNNQTMGLKEILRHRKGSIRGSTQHKNSPTEQMYSSIRSGRNLSKSHESHIIITYYVC